MTRLPSSVNKLILISLLCIGSFGQASAQVITQNTPLDFGRFAIVDNGAPRTLQLLPGGGYTADPQYLFISPPQLGNFTVTGYGAGVPLTVTVSTTTLNNGGGANFSTSSTFTNPGVIVTDGAGEVTFDIGATLTSDGGGSTHVDGGFSGTYTITVTP
ncbi:MAG: DUF4402 domain-containing protein [Pseudomonadota bacterium]